MKRPNIFTHFLGDLKLVTRQTFLSSNWGRRDRHVTTESPASPRFELGTSADGSFGHAPGMLSPITSLWVPTPGAAPLSCLTAFVCSARTGLFQPLDTSAFVPGLRWHRNHFAWVFLRQNPSIYQPRRRVSRFRKACKWEICERQNPKGPGRLRLESNSKLIGNFLFAKPTQRQWPLKMFFMGGQFEMSCIYLFPAVPWVSKPNTRIKVKHADPFLAAHTHTPQHHLW